MPIITTEDEARERLRQMVDADTAPVIDIDTLLVEFKRASLWSASLAVSVGEIILPTSRNGHRYRVTKAGTTGTSEPNWSTSDFSTISDNGVTFEEDGLEYDLWDLHSAAGKGWRLKMGKAAGKVDISSGDDRKAASQLFEHCKEMARYYAPIGVA